MVKGLHLSGKGWEDGMNPLGKVFKEMPDRLGCDLLGLVKVGKGQVVLIRI